MAQGPGSTRQNNGPFTVGGFYNLAPFSLDDGQACSLQFDVNGNLKVTSIGGGSGSNASVGLTGTTAPTSATEIGVVDSSGNLQHVTGLDLTNAFALTVAIVDANGNQITSFGGGAQFAMGSAQSSSALGTIALGYDGTNVRGLLTSNTGQLHVIIDSATLGNVNVTQGTSPWVISFTAPQHVIVDSGTISVTQGTSPWAENLIQVAGVTLGATAVTNFGTAPAATVVPAVNASIFAGATGITSTGSSLNVDVTGGSVTVSGTVTVVFPASPVVWIEGHTGATLDSAAGTPNSQAITIQGNAAAIPVPVSGTVAVTQSTSPWVVAGNLTHNNAAPIADNVGALVAIASSVAPAYNAGDQVLLSTDLSGNLRVTSISGIVDESSFILGVSNETPVGGVFLGGSNVATVGLNQTGAFQITADRKLVTSNPDEPINLLAQILYALDAVNLNLSKILDDYIDRFDIQNASSGGSV
jgi:hypothetical protein